MILDKIQIHVEKLNGLIEFLDNLLNNKTNTSSEIAKLNEYKQSALDLIHTYNQLLQEKNFSTLFSVNKYFFKIVNGPNVHVDWFDEEYFTELVKSVKDLTQEDYMRFIDLISLISTNTFNSSDSYKFVKIIKDNLDKSEIDNICIACSNRIKSINEIISDSFSVRLKNEEDLLEIDEQNLLIFKKNAIDFLSQIADECICFGANKLKKIFENADIDRLKQLYTYFEKYRLDRLEYYTNINPNENLQAYYKKNIIEFPEIISVGSDLRNVTTQDFNSVLGRMFSHRESCSNKFSSKEIYSYKQSIAFLKNFITYLRRDFFYSYTAHCINGGELLGAKSPKSIKKDIMDLPSLVKDIQAEWVMPDFYVERLLKQIKCSKGFFKKGDAKYFIYEGNCPNMFLKEVIETSSSKFNTTQKEIMLYYLPHGRIDMAIQLARLDISKDNKMIHKPKGSQGTKITSKYHLHIYSENDQIFVNVDKMGNSKKPAGYEINSVFSDLLDEDAAIKYFNVIFDVPDPDKNSLGVDTI